MNALPSRRSRFRTSDGNTAPVAAWARLPQCAAQWVFARVTGRRPELPWIPYPAIDALARRIRPDWRVLEIGAGMSTAWLGRRAAAVTSYEADRGWFEFLQQRFAAAYASHIDLQHRWLAAEMCDFSQIADRSLDLAFVDGGPRLQCAQAALPKIKPGGLLYVDNVDDSAQPDSTKRFLLARAAERRERLTFYVGFPPAALFVNEGAILEVSG
jgi:predicted O-methyltransferase YrrM